MGDAKAESAETPKKEKPAEKKITVGIENKGAPKKESKWLVVLVAIIVIVILAFRYLS